MIVESLTSLDGLPQHKLSMKVLSKFAVSIAIYSELDSNAYHTTEFSFIEFKTMWKGRVIYSQDRPQVSIVYEEIIGAVRLSVGKPGRSLHKRFLIDAITFQQALKTLEEIANDFR